MSVRLWLLLGLLLVISLGRNVPEYDVAFDFFAGEDSLFMPVDKDADVAGLLGWRHDEGGRSLRERQRLDGGAQRTDAASP